MYSHLELQTQGRRGWKEGAAGSEGAAASEVTEVSRAKVSRERSKGEMKDGRGWESLSSRANARKPHWASQEWVAGAQK